MKLNIGDIIDDKYRIVRLLGEGGMGSVYEGENVRIRRRVAIKILHTTVAESDDAVQRFEREAQAAGRIGSEHIVEVLDLGELEAGRRYMVMEFLEGEALNERILKVGRISPETTAKMTLELLEGLKAAHAVGIIHRDLKPDNVYLLSNRKDRPDYVKIVDFGISKFSTLGGEFTMTRTGTVMGTPYYLSPEQAKGERNVDERSDLYAVGIIMWEACAGRVPFDGETFNELLFKIVLEPIPPLTKAVKDLDPAFAAIVAKAMARDPEERFQSAEEMQVALRNWLQGAPQTAETTRPPAATWEGRQGTIQAVTPGYATATSAGKDASAVTTTGTKPAANFPESPTQSSSTDSLGESQTPRGWADGSGAPAPRGNTGRRNTILTAAIVLLIGGAGGYVMVNGSQASADTAAAQAQADIERERAEQERREEVARLEAEKAKAEALRAEAEKARLEAERKKAEAELSASEREEQLRKARTQQLQEQTARWRAAQPIPAPAVPAPAPTEQPRKGRKIRTEL